MKRKEFEYGNIQKKENITELISESDLIIENYINSSINRALINKLMEKEE